MKSIKIKSKKKKMDKYVSSETFRLRKDLEESEKNDEKHSWALELISEYTLDQLHVIKDACEEKIDYLHEEEIYSDTEN